MWSRAGPWPWANAPRGSIESRIKTSRIPVSLPVPVSLPYALVCWRGKITVGLCPRHRKRRSRAFLGAWLLGLAGFLLFLVTTVALTQGLSVTETEFLEKILLLIGCLVTFVAIIAGFFATRLLVPARMDEDFIWLKKVAREYLATFSDWSV